MAYSDLTDTERHYWDEYGTLRAITDWAGFTQAQDNRKMAARNWLTGQRNYIKRCAEGQVDGVKPGWNTNNRKARYDTLSDNNLNNATAKHEYTLPANGGTDTEKSYIEEREGYLMIGGDGKSADDAQKARKTANSDWLVARRQKLYSLIKSSSDQENKDNQRSTRYQNLCIATHYGSAWDSYEETHNKYGQVIHDGSTTKSSRARCKDWLDSYLGVSESPAGSNRGSPQPSGWQKRVYGADGVPWCACFAGCSSWDNGADGSVTASVASNVSLAKQGKGIYKGWTSDPSKVHAGDHAFLGSDHTGVIYDRDTGETVEGNTSPGSEGSQYNGGCVAKRKRGWGAWTAGFGLVRFPDD
jgi:hypothetical protein